MARIDYKRCKDCNRHTADCGTLSHTRLCMGCAARRRAENALSIAAKQGAPYLRQQARQYMEARKALLDAGLLSS